MNTFFAAAIGALLVGASPAIAGVVKLVSAFLNENAKAKVHAHGLFSISGLTFFIGLDAAVIFAICGVFS